MLTLHHLENSRSFRILWLLEEAGLEYELRLYSRDAENSFAPDFAKKVHPLGKFPMLTDGERAVVETGAIIDYLADRYDLGGLVPDRASADYHSYRYWLHAAEGTLMPLLVMKLMWNRLTTRTPFFIRPGARLLAGKVQELYLTGATENFFDLMEGSLGRTAWFAGDRFSAADIQMGYPVEAAAVRAGLDDRYPRLQSFIREIRARPAYQRALDKGGQLIPLT